MRTCLQVTDLDKFPFLLVVFGYRRRHGAASLGNDVSLRFWTCGEGPPVLTSLCPCCAMLRGLLGDVDSMGSETAYKEWWGSENVIGQPHHDSKTGSA